MANYVPQAWQVPARQTPWEHKPSISGMTSPTGGQQGHPSHPRDQPFHAFHNQFEEISRAVDILAKNGKLYNNQFRRESVPMMGSAPYETGHRMHPRQSHDYDRMGSYAGLNATNHYGNQRHSRPHEPESMAQAKRRMAAQREGELRNFHQEQQHNRHNNAHGRSDGATSPTSLNEQDRKELIARQHRALYGNDSSFFNEQRQPSRGSLQASGPPSAGRGPSPRTYGPFGLGSLSQTLPQSGDDSQSVPSQEQPSKGPSPQTLPSGNRPREDSMTSPTSNPPMQAFNVFDNHAQASSRTSTSSPNNSPSRANSGKSASISAGVAPIGTRPAPIGSSISSASSKPRVPGNTSSSNNASSSQSPLNYAFGATASSALPSSGVPFSSHGQGSFSSAGPVQPHIGSERSASASVSQSNNSFNLPASAQQSQAQRHLSASSGAMGVSNSAGIGGNGVSPITGGGPSPPVGTSKESPMGASGSGSLSAKPAAMGPSTSSSSTGAHVNGHSLSSSPWGTGSGVWGKPPASLMTVKSSSSTPVSSSGPTTTGAPMPSKASAGASASAVPNGSRKASVSAAWG